MVLKETILAYVELNVQRAIIKVQRTESGVCVVAGWYGISNCVWCFKTRLVDCPKVNLKLDYTSFF